MSSELINRLAYDGKIDALQQDLMSDPKKAFRRYQEQLLPEQQHLMQEHTEFTRGSQRG